MEESWSNYSPFITLSSIYVFNNRVIIEYTILGRNLVSYILSVLWIFVLIELPCRRLWSVTLVKGAGSLCTHIECADMAHLLHA